MTSTNGLLGRILGLAKKDPAGKDKGGGCCGAVSVVPDEDAPADESPDSGDPVSADPLSGDPVSGEW